MGCALHPRELQTQGPEDWPSRHLTAARSKHATVTTKLFHVQVRSARGEQQDHPRPTLPSSTGRLNQSPRHRRQVELLRWATGAQVGPRPVSAQTPSHFTGQYASFAAKTKDSIRAEEIALLDCLKLSEEAAVTILSNRSRARPGTPVGPLLDVFASFVRALFCSVLSGSLEKTRTRSSHAAMMLSPIRMVPHAGCTATFVFRSLGKRQSRPWTFRQHTTPNAR